MKKSIVVVVALLIILVTLLFGIVLWVNRLLITSAATSGEVHLNLIFAVVVPILILTGGYFLDPVSMEIKKSIADVREQMNSRAIRIFVFGESRAGKTTFIGSMVALEPPTTSDSTKTRRVYSVRVLVNINDNRYADLMFQDFRGEQPEDGINMDELFAGAPPNSRVNIIFFIVDLVPETLDGVEVLDWTSDDVARFGPKAEQLIKDRVDLNERYVSKVAMRTIISRLNNPRKLRRIVLIINKVDTLREFISAGYLSSNLPVDGTAKHFYQRTITELSSVCNANGYEGKFEVWVASTRFDGHINRSKLAKLLKSQ